jgi:4-amino-4-deoxy-L-arabinose transferase and related glycosyltransferases of PMT family
MATIAISSQSEGGPRRLRIYFLAGAFLAVFLSHFPLLDIPYHWDELGYFVPAALDFYREGSLVARQTTPNIHPPGLALYLAGIWRIAGYSIPATRLAMLLLASLAAMAAFFLAMELSRRKRTETAFAAVALLLVSPLFFTQAMMAQLDMPAMLFTTLGLLWFLQGRIGLALAASTVLVLTKETGLVLPWVCAAWLVRDRRIRDAIWMAALPTGVLALWILYLTSQTGNPVGNSEFGAYNLIYPLHPVRITAGLLRRVYYLLVEEFRWAATGAALLLFLKRPLAASDWNERPWKIAGSFVAAHVLAVTVLGGATLERYLLPIFPILAAATATVWEELDLLTRRLSQTFVFGGLLISLFWYPVFWSFPLENNLAMVDYVRVQQSAARFLEEQFPSRTVVTAWPFSDALRSPDFGYVARPARTRRLEDFSMESIERVPMTPETVFVLFPQEWEPPETPFREKLAAFCQRYFGYRPPIDPERLSARGWRQVARWERGRFWIAVYSPGQS